MARPARFWILILAIIQRIPVKIETAVLSCRALPEVLARQIYWRFPLLQDLYGRMRRTQPKTTKYLDLNHLAKEFGKAGIQKGACLMVHSSTSGIGLLNNGKAIDNQLQVASELLKFLRSAIGPTGTLLMPTHPYYRDDPGFKFDKTDLRLTYDPVRTPSKVGLLTEIFRRSPGAIRSRHPLSSVTAAGPLGELIIGGFPETGDLPHGRNSAYKRFCDAGGFVVGINVPLINALTIVHVAEELRDGDWPVENFFYERTFNVVEGGDTVTAIVRERHPKWVKSISLNTLRKDLKRNGLIAERIVDGINIGFADGPGVVNHMLMRSANSTYPYFFIRRTRDHG